MDNNYDMNTIAEDSKLNESFETTHTADTLAMSLYTASEILGHNNKSLRTAVGNAQMAIGNTDNLSAELKPFEVDDTAVQRGTEYLQMLQNTSKLCLAESKVTKDTNIDKFKAVNRLIQEVTAEDYS